jgi:hypothetical protein
MTIQTETRFRGPAASHLEAGFRFWPFQATEWHHLPLPRSAKVRMLTRMPATEDGQEGTAATVGQCRLAGSVRLLNTLTETYVVHSAHAMIRSSRRHPICLAVPPHPLELEPRATRKRKMAGS